MIIADKSILLKDIDKKKNVVANQCTCSNCNCNCNSKIVFDNNINNLLKKYRKKLA